MDDQLAETIDITYKEGTESTQARVPLLQYEVNLGMPKQRLNLVL